MSQIEMAPKGTVIPFQDANETVQNLAKQSVAVREKAYCPYSNFAVGAALLCEDGTIYEGCNVENSCYGITVCAEQTAIVKAVSEGNQKFKAIAVCGESKDWTTPCGRCRQFIYEFGSDVNIYIVKPELDFLLITSIEELLPYAFHLKKI